MPPAQQAPPTADRLGFALTLRRWHVVDAPAWRAARPLALLGAWLLLVALAPDPMSRAALMIAAAFLAWSLDLVPDFVVALALIVTWHLVEPGAAMRTISGFASPSWFLLVGVFALGAGLTASGVLERVALRLLLVFPATFRGQALAMVVGGLVITPMLPLIIGRCALTAPLTRRVIEALGYAPGSPPSAGIALAAFAGFGLFSSGFLSGATFNFIAWSLLPADARLGWVEWAVAAAPVTAIVVTGVVTAILVGFRPGTDEPVRRDVLDARLARLGPMSVREGVASATTVGTIGGIVVAPHLGVDAAWIVGIAAVVLALAGLLDRGGFRSMIDWPLLFLLGVILGLPAVIRDAGLDTWLAQAIHTIAGGAATSSAGAVVWLFLLTTGIRLVISEWVTVPLLTVSLLPAAGVLGMHPWVIAFVVLIGSHVWLLPKQFSPYVVFTSTVECPLFTHRQALMIGGLYSVLSLVGLLAAIPIWRALGLLR